MSRAKRKTPRCLGSVRRGRLKRDWSFSPFLADADVAMYGVEAGGKGLETGEHAAPLSAGTPGVLHGNRTYLMQDEDGQILETIRCLQGSIIPA